MEEGYLIKTKSEAKNIVDECKFDDYNVFKFDFDNNIEEIHTAMNRREIIKLIEESNTVLFNSDNYVPHIQIWSVAQKANEVARSGVMYDVLLSPV